MHFARSVTLIFCRFPMNRMLLFSLYKGPFLDGFYNDGADTVMIDTGSSDRDFADCAATMQEMDLVIIRHSNCTYCGLLGVLTWVILHWDPFWVWTHSGEKTPWYLSVRLFRQTEPMNWGGVFKNVRSALAGFEKGQS